VKLVHLAGFIIKKFVMMHGHMNVKKLSNISVNQPVFFTKIWVMWSSLIML